MRSKKTHLSWTNAICCGDDTNLVSACGFRFMYVTGQVPDTLGAQYGEMIMHADGFAQVSLVQDGAVSCSSHATGTVQVFKMNVCAQHAFVSRLV